MKRKHHGHERIRLLTLELAVILPAIALIAVSIMHLKSIQRDHSVEAAIQRDFHQMLSISDKELASGVYQMAGSARAKFPRPDQNVRPRLEKVLASDPHIAHAFLYDQGKGTVLVSQPSRGHEPDFCLEGTKLQTMLLGWFALEGKEHHDSSLGPAVSADKLFDRGRTLFVTGRRNPSYLSRRAKRGRVSQIEVRFCLQCIA
jgi:hypothetical protein